jgi:hypothetical protein
MDLEICFIELDECCWNPVLDRLDGTLNAEHIDIFLRFPTNICMSHTDKPSNGYGHWKTARGKIYGGNLETD